MCYFGDDIKENRRGGACDPCVREGKCVSCFVVNPERTKSHGKPRCRYEITSKYILNKEDGRTWIAFVWLRIVASCRIF